jgi:hypothetical protein
MSRSLAATLQIYFQELAPVLSPLSTVLADTCGAIDRAGRYSGATTLAALEPANQEQPPEDA